MAKRGASPVWDGTERLARNASQRGINLPIGLVGGLHRSRILRVRLDAFGHAHDGVARFFDGFPCTGAVARQNRRTVSRAFFCLHDFDFVAVDISLNLSPEWRTRA